MVSSVAHGHVKYNVHLYMYMVVLICHSLKWTWFELQRTCFEGSVGFSLVLHVGCANDFQGVNFSV